jgi:hypothetical protein
VSDKQSRFKVGDKVRLINEWSKQFGADGVAAVVAQVRENSDGSFVYFVLAKRPPIPVQAVEAEIKNRHP